MISAIVSFYPNRKEEKFSDSFFLGEVSSGICLRILISGTCFNLKKKIKKSDYQLMGSESNSPSSSSPSGKRSRDPEDEVYLDNLHSHKRYLSEVLFPILDNLLHLSGFCREIFVPHHFRDLQLMPLGFSLLDFLCHFLSFLGNLLILE